GRGELRHLLLKTTEKTQQCLVTFVTFCEPSPQLLSLAKDVFRSHPAIKGVVQNVNQKRGNAIIGDTYRVLEGEGSIEEELCGLLFKVSSASFFQVNPQQAENVYREAIQRAELTGEESVVDAYCGVGTLACLFAPHVKRVYGIECVPEAVEDAKANAQKNEIDNTEFICGLAEEKIEAIDRVDLLLVNPPRAGCEPQFLQEIGRLAPKRIIYISCDPATLARDLAAWKELGYSIGQLQPFDMFPQTAHVESLVCLTK
ncbi:23S rRNA (uracil(1939)-C(5))-methyltransferase RlmD, partial [Simkania negevensis]|nr:23S rRNA (uracil(1939)-C(5))-methyltransferase RlmD [Simkania negevensis]